MPQRRSASFRLPRRFVIAVALCVLLLGAGMEATRSAGQTRDDPARMTKQAPVSQQARSCAARAGFRAGQWPAGCWRPYSARSPFNRRIGADPRLHPGSARIVRWLARLGPPAKSAAGVADTSDDWGHPTYYARRSDPVFTVHCSEDWGRCPIERHRVRIPDQARAAGGGDAHMTVIDEASGWEYDFWRVRSKPRGGGRITISWGGRTQLDGDGLDSGATAAGFGGQAGIIRAEELERGRIDHALFMTIRCDAARSVYPSQRTGRRCSTVGGSEKDAAPMGARFQLAMSEREIGALSVPPWKKTILTAMARYGMYFGDTGGETWGIQFESGSTYTSFGHDDRLVAYARKAQVPTWEAPSGARHYVFDLAAGVDWQRRLRVIHPCVSRGRC